MTFGDLVRALCICLCVLTPSKSQFRTEDWLCGSHSGGMIKISKTLIIVVDTKNKHTKTTYLVEI